MSDQEAELVKSDLKAQLESNLASQIARIKAHEGWAKCPDRTQRTAAGRRAARVAIEATVDPEGRMSLADREKAVQNAVSAHYRRLALLSAEARRNRAGA